MEKFPMQAVLAFVRHGMTLAGGYFISSGLATEDDVTAGVAAIVTILGLTWSLARKWQRETRTGSAL